VTFLPQLAHGKAVQAVAGGEAAQPFDGFQASLAKA
jgi:hypothetical protein